MKARTMVFFAGLLGVIGAFLAVGQKRKLKAKEDYMDDKGSGRYLVIGRRRNTVQEKIQFVDAFQVVLLLVIGVLSVMLTGLFNGLAREGISDLFILIGSMLVSAMGKNKMRIGSMVVQEEKAVLDRKETFLTLLRPGLGVLSAVLVLILQPKTELFYYGAAIAILVLLGWNAMELIEQHNILTTRPLPQFGRRGGENDGK